MLLSIITVNLNNIEGLLRTAQSIVDQTYKRFEWIVVDGGSTDGSKDVMETYTSHITKSVSEKDSGIYNAMNKGIRMSNSEYCLFLNSGDTFSSEDALERLSKNELGQDIIYFNRLTKDGSGDYILKYPHTLSFYFFFTANLNHQSCIIKKSAFEKYGFYDETYKISADWMQMVIAVCKYQCSYKYIDSVFTIFERGGISSKAEISGTEERNHFIKNNFGLFYNDYKELVALKSKHGAFVFKVANKMFSSKVLKKYRKLRTRK